MLPFSSLYSFCYRCECREILGEGLAHALGIVDPHDIALARGAVQRHQREAHRHAVIVVGVDGSRRDHGRRRHLDVVGALLHDRADLAQLGGQAAMRSVSLTRQLAMLRSVLVPSAYSAAMAMVIAASGMWLKSASMAFSTPFDLASIQLSPMVICTPICSSAAT